MKLCKVQLAGGETRTGILEQNEVRLLDVPGGLSSILHADVPRKAAEQAASRRTIPLSEVSLLAPVDHQEIWAAGVTYKRSQEARERESEGAAKFYDLVYSAARPELFFKAPAGRVVGPGGTVRVRGDSRWSVPEPELALVISPKLQIVGYTIGNDMSARDIEGENPLYLPQAKIYNGSCAVGPAITLAEAMPRLAEVKIRLKIHRGGKQVFDGNASAGQMNRTPQELVDWLSRETSFPDGAILLTGTCIVPPDDFTLAAGDRVAIEISGIGCLGNVVG